MSKYHVNIKGVEADVYDVLHAFGVTNPALQHLIKKALKVGQRGHKDAATDYQDIIDSAVRAKAIGVGDGGTEIEELLSVLPKRGAPDY